MAAIFRTARCVDAVVWLPSATAAAASDRSCRNEADEVGGELDADEEAVDDEESVGDRDMGAA